ncbi:MAG: hypothetical protein HFJ25_01410 [Clostridia bacterium]|jgi:hypothetical protein|nr:hypothetical protein [Clostridia bacterium]
MAKLTPILDYNNTKNKGKIKGYKVALKKTGVEGTCKMNQNTEIDIIYNEDEIIIRKKK